MGDTKRGRERTGKNKQAQQVAREIEAELSDEAPPEALDGDDGDGDD